MIKFKSDAGTVAFGNTPFTEGVLVFNFQQFTSVSDELNWVSVDGKCFEAVNNFCRFVVKCTDDQISVAVYNTGDKDLFLNDINILFRPDMIESLKADDWLEYIHSINFEGASGVKKVGLSNSYLDSNPSSSMVYMLYNREQHKSYMFMARLPYRGDYISFKALHSEPHLQGDFGVSIISTQQRVVSPGQKAETTAVECLCGSDPVKLLDNLGSSYKEKTTRILKETITGWNSWDFYAGAVTAEDIDNNQAKAVELFPSNINYFIIDEGYEQRWGIWQANWKFSEGLEAVSSGISSKGGIPGIWTAPLLVDITTDLFVRNPEWFARDDKGNIVTINLSYGNMAILDPTHVEVQEFIENTFTRLKQAGFKYFKVDFTQELLKATRFHDQAVPRGKLLTIAFRIIRKAIGEDSYLLACGAPFESVIDIVDACRTTGDIHNFWGHVLKNVDQISVRWWMHRRLWNNDPDFLIVRSEDTSINGLPERLSAARPFDRKAYWKAGREMDLNEVKTYALLVYLSAGDLVLSDELASLNETGVDIIRRVLAQPLNNAAVPLDLFEHHDSLPSIWLASEEEYSLLGLFNWAEDSKHIQIDLSTYGIKNITKITGFWDDKQIDLTDNFIRIDLKPHSCEAFII